MGIRLFVGNLSFSLGDGDLREAFAEIGGVDRAEIVRDRFDGRSRGFGFVEMKTEDDAAVALRAMNGKELAGRAAASRGGDLSTAAVRPQRRASPVEKPRDAASDGEASRGQSTAPNGGRTRTLRKHLDRMTNVARKSVRIARAAANIAHAGRNIVGKSQPEAVGLEEERFPVKSKDCGAMALGAALATDVVGSEAGESEHDCEAKGSGRHRATALVEAATRSHRQIPELSQAIKALSRIERSVESCEARDAAVRWNTESDAPSAKESRSSNVRVVRRKAAG